MNKSIFVTGVAGSGKSSLCKELEGLGYKAYSIEDIDGLFEMVDKATGKPTENYDNANLELVKQHDWICDEKKLRRLVRSNPKSIVFYCGAAANIDNLLPLFDKVFLLKVSNPKILRERLSTRTSNDFGRTPEVQDWIYTWKDNWENHILERGAIVIDANRSLQEIANDIVKRSIS